MECWGSLIRFRDAPSARALAEQCGDALRPARGALCDLPVAPRLHSVTSCRLATSYRRRFVQASRDQLSVTLDCHPLRMEPSLSCVMPESHILPMPRAMLGHMDLPLELGGLLQDVTLRGFAYGQPLGAAPVFVLAGGITADAMPLGDGQQSGWWQALATAGFLQVERHTILAPGTLGHVSDWPALRTLDGTDAVDLPQLTPFDLAEATEAWLTQNDCPNGITWIGASVGGLVGLALAIRYPARIRGLITISAGHLPDGWGTGVRHLQREIVRDALRTTWPTAKDRRLGLATAMKRARQLGLLSYRGRDELNTRFGRLEPGAALPPIASYLEHNGAKFAEHFSPQRFLLLSEAIDRFHLAERDALPDVLARLQCQVTVVGVPSDLLFPWTMQVELHQLLVVAGVRSQLLTLTSDFGHDAFLADQARLAQLLLEHGILQED